MAFRDPTRDIVRGVNIMEMELVNQATWSLLDHAPVEDKTITYADTIMPTFNFLAGMSRLPLKRGVSIVGLGLVYNGLPVLLSGGDLKDIKYRYPGILQRTGLSSLLFNGSMLLAEKYAPTSNIVRNVPYIFPVVATALWSVLTIGLSKNKADPFADPDDSAQTVIDKTLLGPESLYRSNYDPEGLLGCITTAITMDFGYMFVTNKLTMRDSTVLGLAAIGLGYGLAKLLPKFNPVSKPYWTPSFVLIAGGYSVLKFNAISSLIPYMPECVRYVLTCVGRRSIEVFFSAGVLSNIGAKFNFLPRLKAKLAQLTSSDRAGDLLAVGLWDGLLAALAVGYVKYGLKIRY